MKILLRETLRRILLKFPRIIRKLESVRLSGEYAKFRDSLDIPVIESREAFHNKLIEQVGKSGPIRYLEFGVYRGKSFSWWADANDHADSRFHGYDTFEGLPEDWQKSKLKGHFSTGGELPKTDDPRVTFHKGLFQETLNYSFASFQDRDGTLICHIDCDIYSGAIYVLFQMDPILTKGDIVIFDEFKDHNNEFLAFTQFMSAGHSKLQPFARAASENQWAFKVI